MLDDPNIGNILLGANAVVSEADHQLVTLMIDSQRDSTRVVEYLRGGFVDAAIILSARVGDPISAAVAELGLPASFVGHPPDAPGIPYIGIDNQAAAEAIVRRLVATGRRRIGMLASGVDRDSGQDRLIGFARALGDAYDPTLVVRHPFYSYTAGAEGMAELLTREPGLDGVFAARTPSRPAPWRCCTGAASRSPTTSASSASTTAPGRSDACRRSRRFGSPPRRSGGGRRGRCSTSFRAQVDFDRGLILPTDIVWRESA